VKSKSKNSKPARVNSGSFKAGDLKASNQRGSFKENNLKAYNSRVPRGGARPQEVRSSQTDIPRNWRVVVGDHAIRAALQKSPQWIKQIWIKQGYESSQFLREIADEAKRLGISFEVRPEPQIAKVYANHQGALVFVDGRPRLKNAEIDELKTCILIALDGVEDPHNLGAILRTAWLTGARAVLGPEDRSVGLSPTVHKVACGGVEVVPFEQLSQFHSTLEEFKKQGFWVFGLSHLAKKSLLDVKIPCWFSSIGRAADL
jgi:23S rRNA (guanosine2251-2'-O)-methyltransferase